MCFPYPSKVKSEIRTILDGISSCSDCHVETDAGLNRHYQKLFLVTFDFALDLGFNIFCLNISQFFFQASELLHINYFFSSKGSTRIMAKLKYI